MTHSPPKIGLVIAASLLFAGCGGGGGASTTETSVAMAITGVAVDGYIQGGTVFADHNGNGLLDPGEPSATTDSKGAYTLSLSGSSAQFKTVKLVITGGTDTSTGMPFTHTMSAHVESTAASTYQPITPLSTLVTAMVLSGTPASEARTSVARVLGLSSTSVLDKDPLLQVMTEPSLLQKMVSIQKAMEVLASADKTPAERATGAPSANAIERIAKALGAEITRIAASLPSNPATLPSVASLVTGATTNHAQYFSNAIAIQSASALASDIANLTESTLAVGMSQILKDTNATSNTTSIANALTAFVDTRLTAISSLQVNADKVAKTFGTSTPTSLMAPIRLDEVAKTTGTAAALQALVQTTQNIPSVANASASGTALSNIASAVAQIPSSPVSTVTSAPTTVPSSAPSLAPSVTPGISLPTTTPTSTAVPGTALPPTAAPTAPPNAASASAPTQTVTTAPIINQPSGSAIPPTVVITSAFPTFPPLTGPTIPTPVVIAPPPSTPITGPTIPPTVVTIQAPPPLTQPTAPTIPPTVVTISPPPPSTPTMGPTTGPTVAPAFAPPAF